MAKRLTGIVGCLGAGGAFLASNFMEFVDNQPRVSPVRLTLAAVFFGLALWLAGSRRKP